MNARGILTAVYEVLNMLPYPGGGGGGLGTLEGVGTLDWGVGTLGYPLPQSWPGQGVGTLDGGRGVGTLGREGVGTLDGGRYLGVPPPPPVWTN